MFEQMDHAGIAGAGAALCAAIAEDGRVTATIETQLQNAIHAARLGGADRTLVGRLESASAIVTAMSNAQRCGRPNLYHSQRLRLRRLVAA